VRERLDEQLDDIAAEVNDVRSERDDIQRELDDIAETIRTLEPFRDIPLNLGDYRGYDTLEVFVGQGPDSLARDLETNLERVEVFEGQDLQAVFVHEDEADDAQDLLVRAGFRNAEVPDGEGSPADRLREARQRRSDLESQLKRVDQRLESLGEQHRDLLLCAEEDLSIEVEKAEAPLDFGSTERTFVCDAWVPASRLDEVKTAISEAASGRVAFEILDEGQRDEHGREDEPPTRYDHGSLVQPFDFLMETFSTPKYDEIDPTVILTLVFPLFFGFVIGDLAYGAIMLALGWFLYRRVGPKSEAAKSLGFAIAISGAWAMLFGGLLFKDALGMPMYAAKEGVTWPGMLGVTPLAEPAIHKIETGGVKAMLALSVLAAFVHLFVGFTFGFINELGHDTKHAIAQIAWTVTLTGISLLCIIHGPENLVSGWLVEGLNLGSVHLDHGHVESMEFTGFAQMLPWYLLGPGVLVLILTEGLMGLMETFSLLANVISYTRLAGIAVAKGGIVAAFNDIFLNQMVLDPETGVLFIVAGFALFTIAQLLMFVLGLLSGGIQSIRLNYVEFFLKFFEGGGKRFSPFGRDRSYTTDSR